MSGSAGMRKVIFERDSARLEVENLREQVADLEDHAHALEEKVKSLRGMGTPGLVIGALNDMVEMAEDMIRRTETQLVIWQTVRDWASKLATEEKEEWGDLVDAMDLRDGPG